MHDKKEANRKVKHLYIPGQDKELDAVAQSMEFASRGGNLLFSLQELAAMNKPVR